jgi:hypothetical protein
MGLVVLLLGTVPYGGILLVRNTDSCYPRLHKYVQFMNISTNILLTRRMHRKTDERQNEERKQDKYWY